MKKISAIAFSAALLAACQPAPASPSVVADSFASLVKEPSSLQQLAADLRSGSVSAETLTQAFLDRIAAVDDAGPALNAVLAINPNALAEAKALDALLAEGVVKGPLHGVPILVKDNIDTADPVPTTAGSLALQLNVTGRDAPLVARLRAAGAIILGKTNLSEWANFRSDASTSGWSGAGGQTRNPHVLDRNPCGSSSGSGAAVAAGLAAGAIGTETDGSIVCPSSVNGIVGLKPTVGLVPRTHIVPISATQDTAGPMTLTVSDAALLLTVMAGTDASDPATEEADSHKQDYTTALNPDALAGKRIGVARFLAGYHAPTDADFEEALTVLKEAGAELVEIETFPSDRRGMNEAEYTVLLAEFRAGVNDYLASTPAAVKTRTLADLIAFNSDTPAELEFFGQNVFEEAAKAPALTDKAYLDAKAKAARLAGKEGIDFLLSENNVVALVAPTGAPVWPTDPVNGDHFLGAASGLAAVAGYPHITVPMGEVRDLPVGLSFFGAKWSEAELIGLAFAYEQKSNARTTPEFFRTLP
ncbi:MAG: amidase [Hyphomonadaceae bacterium]